MRNWIKVFALATLLLPSATVAAADGHKKQRNIVLMISDDHGPDLGAYGNPVIQTPNLDALADDGVLFTSAFATTASCSASRSVILTGLQNHRTGQYGHLHDFHRFQSWDDIKGLPVLLGDNGYRTAYAGKFHVGPEKNYAFQQHLPSPSRNPAAMAEGAADFIAADDDKPFFLYYATNDPHRAGRLDEDGNRVGLEDFTSPDHFGNSSEGAKQMEAVTYDPDDIIVPDFLPDTPTSRIELAQYYQSVSRLDKGIGRLIEILKAAGKYDDTLIIYMSDHGIAFHGAKTTTYDAGLRSPLIVRHPDSKKRGSKNDAMISWVDITPTILDFADIEQPTYQRRIGLDPIKKDLTESHKLHGRSLLPILDNADAKGRDEIYASHTFHEIQMYYPMRVVRGRQYKLIWNLAHGLTYPSAADLWESPTFQQVYRRGLDTMYGPRTVRDYMHRAEFELYDIAADPSESNNLAGDPAYAKVLAELKAKIKAFQSDTHDPWLLKWTYQ